ncbi:MAG: anti-sigma factor [Thermomicrobiales bacterium]
MSTLEPADRPDHHDHAYYEGLVRAAALGTITPDERAALMAYVATDPGASLRSALAESAESRSREDDPTAGPDPASLDDSHADLPTEAASSPEPPAVDPGTPHVPNRLGQRHTSPVTPSAEPRSIFASGSEGIVTIAAPAATDPIGPETRVSRNRTLMRAIAVIAFVTLLAGAVFLGYQLAPRNDAASDSRVNVALSFATPLPDDARAALHYDPETGLLVLSTTNLPTAPADRVYQVWLVGTNGPVSAGTLGPGGFATMLRPGMYQTLEITLEPGPTGSPSPTSRPIVTASLEALPSS